MKRPNHNDRWTEKAYSRENRAAAAAASSSGDRSVRADIEMNDLRRGSGAGAGAASGAAAAHLPSCRAARQHSFATSGQQRRHVTDYCMNSESLEYDGMSGTGAASGFRLTPETHKAIEAVRFIAAHLKNEDDYAEVC